MRDFKVTDGSKDFILRLPTSIKEITSDYLLAVTNDIVIAPYHAVIATIYRCKLPEVISSNKKSRAMAIAIVPIFVKANTEGTMEDNMKAMFDNLSTGDKIIIAGTDIERGYQLSTPKNVITIDNVVRIYNYDSNFAKGVMADQNYYFFVDFKLVPINDIKGYYNETSSIAFVNPFSEVISDERGN